RQNRRRTGHHNHDRSRCGHREEKLRRRRPAPYRFPTFGCACRRCRADLACFLRKRRELVLCRNSRSRPHVYWRSPPSQMGPEICCATLENPMAPAGAPVQTAIPPSMRPPESRSLHAGYALAVLFAINLLNFYDRQTLGPLAEPIRKEFHLTDTQLGLLGTMFTIL